ncbi:MAG TPA: LysR family transcriptional regulator [Hyphomicrobiaceae bacterium]|nr:LysR family transcriptional regulator [Hyphomicrobiaceae bacterium]
MLEPETSNLRHLRAFLAVQDLGSSLAASRAVHVSQPAVTQAIAKLETTLGVSLFVRHSAGMVVTEAGAVFGRRVRRALTHIRHGTLAVVATGGQARTVARDGFDKLVTAAQLRALISVSDSGNFSLAARSIGISQPSLHRLARDLERLSGVVMYERKAHGIALSEGAAEMARLARLAFGELRQAGEELDHLKGIRRSRMHIGALPLVRTGILPRVINAHCQAYPQTRIRVVDGPYDALLRDLRHGTIDILVGALREPAPIDDIVQTALFSDRLSIVARRGHPLGRKRRITVADLAAYPWIAPSPGAPARAQFDKVFAGGHDAFRDGLVEASSLVVVRGLLLESDRLTLLSPHQVEPELRLGMLEIVPFELGDVPRRIGMTVRADWQPTPMQAAFVVELTAGCAVAAGGVAAPAGR